jgi:uncharacterized protein (DUF2126 family)
MAVATCAHCQNQSFEIQEVKIDGANRQLLFVQCTGCGAPVDVVDNRAVLRRHEQDARIKNLEQQLTAIASAVSHIGRMVAALANQRTI